MKLATTMGIELTYMPSIWDWMVESYGEHYVRRFPNSDHEEEGLGVVVQHRGEICSFAARNLRTILELRRVAVHKCGTDPDCVEVSTKPYNTLDALMRRVNIIGDHALDLDLVPALKHFNGGGAHIHTGTQHVAKGERMYYVKRMQIFAAQNPWLSWAFIGLNDNDNAEPLTQEELSMGEEDRRTRADIQKDIERAISRIEERVAELHDGYTWRNCRERYSQRVDMARDTLMTRKLELHRFIEAKEDFIIHLGNIDTSQSKDHALCHNTSYGTVEFRVFEMPPERETLAKYIRLADAIVRHVTAQTYTTFDSRTIPSDSEALRSMPLKARVAGFKRMLVELGMDPAEFESEAQHIRDRYAFYKDAEYNRKRKQQDRSAAAMLAELDPQTSDDSLQVAHDARVALMVKRCQDRRLRRITRQGRHPAFRDAQEGHLRYEPRTGDMLPAPALGGTGAPNGRFRARRAVNAGNSCNARGITAPLRDYQRDVINSLRGDWAVIDEAHIIEARAYRQLQREIESSVSRVLTHDSRVPHSDAPLRLSYHPFTGEPMNPPLNVNIEAIESMRPTGTGAEEWHREVRRHAARLQTQESERRLRELLGPRVELPNLNSRCVMNLVIRPDGTREIQSVALDGEAITETA